jgi:hypothetical protein
MQDKMLGDAFNYTPNTLNGFEAADCTNSWVSLILNETFSGLHTGEYACKWSPDKIHASGVLIRLLWR